MADPFIGEIKSVAFNFAAYGWASCSGQQMAISQNTALFALLGTMYGGNGQTTFNLPDLRGRCAIGQGQGLGLMPREVGEISGTETTQLQVANMPAHNHTATITGTGAVSFKMSGDQGDVDDPTGAMFAKIKTGTTFQKGYDKVPSTVITMSSDSVTLDTTKLTTTIGNNGSGAIFNNMPPFLVVNYIIAMMGIFPTRN